MSIAFLSAYPLGPSYVMGYNHYVHYNVVPRK